MNTKSTDNLVSVIMATYNRENYLPYAIESVLNQTYQNFELHIIDDGSVDATRALVNTYKDPRIRYYYQENKGQSSAINVGVEHALGDFITFLDSDNLWKLDKLERQVGLLHDNPDYQIVYGENEIIDENGNIQPVQEPVTRHSGNIMKKLLVFNFINFNTTMIRAECFRELGGMTSTVPAGPDYDLFLKFSTRYRFLYVPQIFAQYRVMTNQMSSNKDRRFRTNHAILTNFIETYSELLDRDSINYTWCRYYTSRGRYHAAVGRLGAAFMDYLSAMRCQPFSRHPWRAMARLILLRR
jgi:glycosyltransferase involved in cell wall biosynthesis